MIATKFLQVGSKKLTVERPHLKKWMELEQIKAYETDKVKKVYQYLSVFLDLPELEFDILAWDQTLELYVECLTLSIPTIKFPFLSHPDKTRTVNAWDYPQRLWYAFGHMIAKTYGWSLEYIADLDLDDGLALLQEILVEHQLDREWEWSLSEMAYPYDSRTKTNRFKALPRPSWMQGNADVTIKKVKMLKSLLPVGNVIGLSPDDPFLAPNQSN